MLTTRTPNKKRNPATGRWRKGLSGNPSGRPAGSRNKSTILIEEMLDSRTKVLVCKAIERALNGDPMAMRLCLERMYPPLRERPIDVDLPSISDLGQAATAASAILKAAGQGRVTVEQAEGLTRIIAMQVSWSANDDIEQRVAALEKNQPKAPPDPNDQLHCAAPAGEGQEQTPLPPDPQLTSEPEA
jgi:hypothetical protein